MVPDGVQKLPSSPDEMGRLFARYRRHLCDARIGIRDADARFCSFFDAGIMLAKITVRAHGLRVTGSNMNHYLLFRLASSVLGHDGAKYLSVLESARSRRNHATYDEAGSISDTEVGEIERAVVGFEALVRGWLVRVHPDLLPPELPLG